MREMEEESELMNKKNINKYNQEEEPKIHAIQKEYKKPGTNRRRTKKMCR